MGHRVQNRGQLLNRAAAVVDTGPMSRASQPRVVLACALAIAGCLVAPQMAMAATDYIDVTTTTDRNSTCGSGGDCSLREAVAAAVAGAGSYAIRLPAGHYFLTLGPIAVSGSVNLTLEPLSQSVGPDAVAIHGNNATRLFSISGAASFYLKRIALVDGYDSGFFGAAINQDTTGTVTVRGSYLGGNHSRSGAAIRRTGPSGELRIEQTQFENNVADAGGGVSLGGAVYAAGAAEVMIDGSTFKNNDSIGNNFGRGGAVALSDDVEATITNSTFDDNTAGGAGGAIDVSGVVIAPSLVIRHSTFVDNRSDAVNYGSGLNGGAISAANATLDIGGSVFSQNGRQTGASSYSENVCDVSGGSVTYTSRGGNFFHENSTLGTLSCGAGSLGTDAVSVAFDRPGVGIASYVAQSTTDGQITPGYLPIGRTAPLVNAGTASSCDGLYNDIRRGSRLIGAACDSGAYEVGGMTDVRLGVARQTASPTAGSDIRFHVTLDVISDQHDDGIPASTIEIAFWTDVTLQGATYTTGSGTCTAVSASTIRCSAPSMLVGGQAALDLDVRLAAGATGVTASVLDGSDPVPADNYIGEPFTVAAAPTPPNNGGGGNNGGGNSGGGNNGGGNNNPPVQPLPLIRPTLTLRNLPKKVLRLKKRKLNLRASCPAGVQGGCTVATTLRSAKKVGKRYVSAKCSTVTIAAGKTATIRCSVSKQNLKFFPKKKGRAVTLALVSRDGSGTTERASYKRVLRSS